jgi:hypothetical protein
MLRPGSAWRRLAKEPGTEHWLARPLFVAFVLGCSVSVMTSGRLTLRLLLPAMLYATFVPMLQIAALAVCRGRLPFRKAVGLFFVGHAPWSLWVIGSAALWGLLPTTAMYPHAGMWKETALVILAWSAYIDFCFFRDVVGGAAIRRLAVQRVLCWLPGLAIFVAPAGWQVVASAVGR